MISLTKFKSIAVLSLISLLGYSNGHTQSKLKICLTGRVVENFQSYGNSFINAANMAKEQSVDTNNVIIKSYFYNNRPLEPVHAYNKMVKEGCSAIIGFEYLSDLLLAVKKQKNIHIPIFTSYASTRVHETLPRNIFIFMPTYDFLANKMIEFLKNHAINLNSTLLVTEINRDEMVKYKDAYSTLFNKYNIRCDTLDFLENDSQIIKKINVFLINKKYENVFLLSGAIASAKIINFMDNHKILFLGTENFGSSTSPTIYVRLNDKNVRSYFIRHLDYLKPTPKLLGFRKNYINNFHVEPTLLAAYTYDAIKIILNTFSKYKNVKTDNIYKINYSGVTGISLKNNVFTRSNSHVILSINENGYKNEE